MLFKKTLEERVLKAKKDEEELNMLIEEYKPFIASTLQKITGKFLQYGYDDELTIGMMAFKEAIDAYDKGKGKFLNLAKQVITLREIDYYRKYKKLKNTIYLKEDYDIEDKETNHLMLNRAIEEYKCTNLNEMRKSEILEYKKELKEWGIEFVELVKVSPKQQKLKKTYKNIAQLIIQDQDMLNKLISMKRLPIKEIEKNITINRMFFASTFCKKLQVIFGSSLKSRIRHWA